MRKIKIGVLGLYRGSSTINYCLAADNTELENWFLSHKKLENITPKTL